MSEGTFFTFSLCLLNYPFHYKDQRTVEQERMQVIVAHSMHRAGKSNHTAIPDSEVADYVHRRKLEFDHSDEESDLVRGAIACNVNLKGIRGTLRQAMDADRFICSHEAIHGKDALVFISTKLFWDTYERNDPSYRDFTVLCAINSCIGFKKTPVLIRRSFIVARQLGFKTMSIVPRKAEQLTTQKLRDSFDRLESHRLIARVQASRTCVYFSTWLKADELREAVKEKVLKRQAVVNRREIDRALIPRTKREPSENHLKRNSPKSTEKEPLKNEEPRGNQEGTTTGTKQEPTEEPLKQVPSKKCPSINAPQEGRESAVSLLKEGKAAEPEPEPELPPARQTVHEHLKGLFKGAERFTAECVKAEPWTGSRKPWPECVAIWAFDRMNAEKRKQRRKVAA